MSRPLKDEIATVRARLLQAGLRYEVADDDPGAMTAQCPVCDSIEPTMTVVITRNKATFSCSHGCEQPAIIAALGERHDPRRDILGAYEVTWTTDKTPKLVLPGIPPHDDLAGLAAWVTSVFRLDPRSPVTKMKHEGHRGPDGHVNIRRAGAADLRFEPITALYSARRMIPALGSQLLPTDDEPYGFKDEHCKRIAHVIHLACGACEAPDAAQEAGGIVGTFTLRAKAIEGYTTYGTPTQRFEALEALRPNGDGFATPSYLIDDSTGEIVIRVSDLQTAAREYNGTSLHHGWLDARMDHLGWSRARVHGYAQPGRDGRKGPHSRCDFYRGHMPAEEAETPSVST
jgi:hypothetical protein